MKQSGFTLVEVVIAISILAILSLLTQQSIQQAVSQKNKIQSNLERSSELRSAFRVIERDIQMAFHFIGHNDFKPPPNIPGTPPPPPVGNQNQENETVFKGTEDRVDFTSLGNARIYTASFESDQKEIGYYTSDCRKLARPSETSNCLWRRVSNIIDDDVVEGGAETVLLENVSNLQFKYYNNQIQEWLEEWDSDQTQDNRTANRFPDAVEVIIETDLDEKQLSFSSVVPVRHPNNDTPPPSNTAVGGPGGGIGMQGADGPQGTSGTDGPGNASGPGG